MQVQALSSDAEARRLAFVRERALRDEISQLNAARQVGRHEGASVLLSKLSIRRFGPLPEWAQQHLAHATSEQLEQWGERIFDASTLEDVFH